MHYRHVVGCLVSVALFSALAQQPSLPILPPAILDRGSGSTAVAGKTITVTYPHTTTYGATLIVGCGGSQYATTNWTATVTDSESSNWTQDQLFNESTTQWGALWHATNVVGQTADAITVTIAGSNSSNQSIACQLWEILGTYGPAVTADVGGGSVTASNTALSANGTATGMNEYAFSILVSGNTGPPTVTAGTSNPWVLDSAVTPASGSMVFAGQSMPLTAGSNRGLSITVTAGATLSQANAAVLVWSVYSCPILEVHLNGTSLTSYARASGAGSAPTTGSIGTTTATLLSSNSGRKSFIIQNTGTTVLKVLLGTVAATQTNYTVALKACSAADAGDGGAYIDALWIGAVQIISSGASGAYVVSEVQ